MNELLFTLALTPTFSPGETEKLGHGFGSSIAERIYPALADSCVFNNELRASLPRLLRK